MRWWMLAVAGLALAGCKHDEDLVTADSGQPPAVTGSGPEVDISVRPAVSYATSYRPQVSVQPSVQAPVAPVHHRHRIRHVEAPPPPPVDEFQPANMDGTGQDDAADGAPRYRHGETSSTDGGTPPWQKQLDQQKIEKGWRHKEAGDTSGDPPPDTGDGDGDGG